MLKYTIDERMGAIPGRLLKNAHLLRFPHPSSLRRTSKYASLLRISGALHLGIFEQPAENAFFSNYPVVFLTNR
jgi:hypothetical protein